MWTNLLPSLSPPKWGWSHEVRPEETSAKVWIDLLNESKKLQSPDGNFWRGWKAKHSSPMSLGPSVRWLDCDHSHGKWPHFTVGTHSNTQSSGSSWVDLVACPACKLIVNFTVSSQMPRNWEGKSLGMMGGKYWGAFKTHLLFQLKRASGHTGSQEFYCIYSI
jgi:hypothetical protein